MDSAALEEFRRRVWLRNGKFKFAGRRNGDRCPVALTLSEAEEKFQIKKNPNRFKEREKLEEGEKDPELRRLLEDFSWCKFAFIKGDCYTAFQLMSDLKASLKSFRSLPPLFEETPNRVRELKVARDIHEQAVDMAPFSTDRDAITREFLQLKPYYEDPCASLLPPSHVKNMNFSNYLLKLLEQRRIADFHTELRSLSATDLADYSIRHAIRKEKLLRKNLNLDCQLPGKTTSNERCSSLSSNGTEERALLMSVPVPEKSCPLGV